MVGDVMAHRVGCGGSLVGDEVNHLINDKGCDGSLVGDQPHCIFTASITRHYYSLVQSVHIVH